MYCVGIDIGSTASKTVVMQDGEILLSFVLPTGWSSKETSENIRRRLISEGYDPEDKECKVVATGYGRIAVPYATQKFSEIKCHGLGGKYIFETEEGTIIDIGGQDTKVITLSGGRVTEFLMNDKCSAGTGKFLEIMANRLGLGLPDLATLAEEGAPITISSMCTVFAESEVISSIGAGEPRENIAAGIIESVTEKVAQLCKRHGLSRKCFLTGGLCDTPMVVRSLSRRLETSIETKPMGRYAGAVGAAICAQDL